MRALLFAIGTRGDVEPFLALAEMLKRHGWEAKCVFPEQFRSMTTESGIEFHGFNKRFLELLESQTGKVLMGGSGNLIERFRAMAKLSNESWQLQEDLIDTQDKLINDYQPDRIFFHPKCVYPVLWEYMNPGKCILICPIPCILHKVKEYTTMGLRGNGNYGTVINSLSYLMVNWIRVLVFYRMLKKHRKHIVPKVGLWDIYRTLIHQTITWYTISPSLFPKPDYWDDHLKVTGFLVRNRTINWQPEQSLLDFLSHYRKILFITFGSMINQSPEQKTAHVIEVLKQLQIPAIINTSWGGLTKLENTPESILFVQNIPYDWILPKMYAVVHHGGSGTTHTACKNGCPSLIIPHIVDQFFWNNRLASLKLGPKGVSIDKLTTDALKPLVHDLWENNLYKENALGISKKMASQGNPAEILSLLTLR